MVHRRKGRHASVVSMSDRIFALVWLGVCTLVAVQIVTLSTPIAYDPVGPKAYPLLLVTFMVACCMILIVRPDLDVQWPPPTLLARGALLVGLLLIYAWVFEIVGAPLATAAMALGSSRLFGARWRAALLTAFSAAIFSYLLFDQLLDVNLPVGRIWPSA